MRIIRNFLLTDFFIKWIQECFTKTSLVNLLNKCYDYFSSFIKFLSSERNIENTMSDLYLMKKVIVLKKIQVTMKTFAPQFSNHFTLSLNRKKSVVMRAMRKKLNIFTLQLPIYYILQKESLSITFEIVDKLFCQILKPKYMALIW